VRSTTSPDWLDALLPALGLSSEVAAARIRASAAGKGVVITTGQQPGLFGGPIYTWSKALSALALADALESATGIPAAPVFWAATDDSDFAEASWTMVVRPGGVDELRMDGDSTGTSMAHMPLGDVSSLVERLERAAGSAAFRAPLEIARRAYRTGQTVGGAYLELLRGILEPLGIAVLDAAHPAVRRAGAPVIRQALRRAESVTEAVAERDRALMAAGHAPQVASVAGLSLVFATQNGQRQRVPNGNARTVAESHADEALSPNVLLRPVVERAILPTVAYVAGPAELAYFAQTGAVARALDAALPLALPRWSCTILEPQVEEILARLSLDAEELRDPHAAETRLGRAALPSEISSAIARMRSGLDEGLAVLERHGSELVPPAVIAGGARSIAHRILRMERRLVSAMKRRIADTLQHVATARGSLYPAGKRQERALNLLPFLARHGPQLLERMLDGARAHAHTVLESASPAAGDVAHVGPSTDAA
jgi:bacillithiol biosynthesis cysteine-adding enzyme BshC